MNIDRERIERMRQSKLVQPSICVERIKYMTESYRATEGEPEVIRRAKAFLHELEHISVIIYPDDLIVGQPSSKVRGGSISPEVRCDWILDEMDTVSERDIDPYVPLTAEEKDVLRDVVPYWQERSVYARWKAACPTEAQQYDGVIFGGGAFCGNNQHYGHISVDYAMLLQFGAEGILDKVNARLADTAPGTPEHDELTAMGITLRGLMVIGERYADMAEALAQAEKDPDRKRELEQIAAVCRHVPRHPARSFHEALQSTWFAYLCAMIENWGTGNTLLRADQYLYPYYEQDIRTGAMTEEQATMLVCSFYVTCNFGCVVYSEMSSHGFAGANSGTSITLGGVKPDGTTAVNALTYVFLNAEELVNLSSEDIVIRINDNSPADYLPAAGAGRQAEIRRRCHHHRQSGI